CLKATLNRDTIPEGSDQGCTVTDGTAIVAYTVNLKVDLTPPAITAVIPDRQPDHDGWYTHPVGFTAQGQDSTSGLAGCQGASNGGPYNPAAALPAPADDPDATLLLAVLALAGLALAGLAVVDRVRRDAGMA
ncbi:MAG: hypothetical protein ACAH82_18620, partial [Solirubrobacteraceae bacterium]